MASSRNAVVFISLSALRAAFAEGSALLANSSQRAWAFATATGDHNPPSQVLEPSSHTFSSGFPETIADVGLTPYPLAG